MTGTSGPISAQTHDTRPDVGQYRVEAVIVRGNRRIPASTIRKRISIHPGDLYDPKQVECDLAALKGTGYFDDVRAEAEDKFGTTDGKIVIFYVREKDERAQPGMPSSPPTALPDEMGEQYGHASKLLWAGELKSAQSAFPAVLQKKPDYSSAKALLGLTLARLSEQSEIQGERARAVAQQRAALAQDLDEAYWHKALAQLLHAQSRAEEAATECAQAANLSPDDSDLARGCGFGASPELGIDNTIPNAEDFAGTPNATKPVRQNAPEPDYSEKGRRARLQGRLVIWAVVGVHGEIEQEAVAEPLGVIILRQSGRRCEEINNVTQRR